MGSCQMPRLVRAPIGGDGGSLPSWRSLLLPGPLDATVVFSHVHALLCVPRSPAHPTAAPPAAACRPTHKLPAPLQRLRPHPPMPPGAAAQGAVQRLRADGAATPPAAAAAAAAAVVTGTGFYGGERAAVRELARLAGVQYSGDMVQGHTTHLVLAPGAATASRKLQKAAEWGIPALRLQWLLDSVAAGKVQPAGPYLIDVFDEVDEGPAAAPAASGAAQHPASCRELPARHRPSSVASNPLQQGRGAQQAAPAAVGPGGCASGCHMAAATGQQEAAQPDRPALAPVANRLADQLRRMSIAPEAQPAHQHDELQRHQQQPQQPQQQPAPQHRHPQHRHPQPSDSPPQQRSPSVSMGSPQRSLSLQGMVAADAALASPAEVGSSAAAAAGGRHWAEQAAPGVHVYAYAFAAGLGAARLWQKRSMMDCLAALSY